jgi:hypothetical protein
MFVIQSATADARQPWSRRDCLRVGLGSTLGLMTGPLFAHGSTSPTPLPRGRSFGQAKSCILIYLFGGPSHLDIWDLKPAAPPEIRGEFKPQPTCVPGMQITEHLPRLAQHADKYAIIRSLSHGDSAHGSAGHAMMTGRSPRVRGEVPPHADDFPHYGAVLARFRPAGRAVAPFVSFPWAISTSTNIVPGQNGGFLGRVGDPLRLEATFDNGVGFGVPLSTLPAEVDAERMRDRRQLHERLDASSLLGANPTAGEMGELYRRAFRFMDSRAMTEAFRLDKEPARLRARYGQNVFGQSLLLARRLAEAGVPMITVFWPERKEPEAYINRGVKDSVAVPAWDTHGTNVGKTPNFPFLRDKLLPVLDLASTALIEDLHARGLWDQTLVAWTGEFGRTPKINGDAGRDHYGNVFSAMLGGGGIQGGQVYGASDAQGAFPADNPVSPAAFAATLYHCLGVATHAQIPDRLGRPVHVMEKDPIAALVR